MVSAWREKSLCLIIIILKNLINFYLKKNQNFIKKYLKNDLKIVKMFIKGKALYKYKML